MKRLICVTLLICILFLTGCRSGEKVDMMVNQMRGDTEISSVRTDTLRAGIVWSNHQFECTDDGVYYLAKVPFYYDNGERILEATTDFLFFSPDDSGEFIKLCGRPDCTHDTIECNACFDGANTGVSYYNGYLYIGKGSNNRKYLFDLYRFNLDGTDRVKVGSYGSGKLYSGTMINYIHDGVFSSTLIGADPETGFEKQDRYNFVLDSDSNEGELAACQSAPVKQDNTVLGHYKDENGEIRECVYQVDLRKNTSVMLFDKQDYPDGYWDSKAGYFLEDGKIVKVPYETGEREVLFEIQQEGNYSARFFPDCIMLIEQMGKYVEGTPRLQFYSWEGEYYGETLFTCSRENIPGMDAIVGGETSGKIYLSITSRTQLPAYYIDKSEFGTGNIQLHPCRYPDMTDEELIDLFGELPQ